MQVREGLAAYLIVNKICKPTSRYSSNKFYLLTCLHGLLTIPGQVAHDPVGLCINGILLSFCLVVLLFKEPCEFKFPNVSFNTRICF